MENFLNKYRRLSELATDSIRKALSALPENLLSSACRYSALAPGKRFRPVLAQLSAELLGLRHESGKGALLERFATALDLLHTSTLIHDDLPAIDNDSVRRGIPTCHIKYGEDLAILAGDALCALAFNLILVDPFSAQPPNAAASLAAEIFPITSLADELPAISAALTGMLSRAYFQVCEGQYFDLHPDALGPDANTEAGLIARHRKKTGALISASAAGPAIIAGATRFQYSQLASFGHELGLLFQITDDLLDATSTSAELGKDAGTDQRSGRVTFVSLFGVNGAKQRAQSQADLATAALSSWGAEADDLRALVQFALTRTK